MHFIKKSIPDRILAQYQDTNQVNELLTQLGTRYDLSTSVTTAYDVQMLFQVRGPVQKFDETLDKLEKIYQNLNVHGKTPDDSVYIAAINNATPPQYKHVIGAYDARIKFYNEDIKEDDDDERKMEPHRLIEELRGAFRDYNVQNQTAQKYIHLTPRGNNKFEYKIGKITKESIGRGRGQGSSRGGPPHNKFVQGRGRFIKNYDPNFKVKGKELLDFLIEKETNKEIGIMTQQGWKPKCYNCGKFGHIGTECRAPKSAEFQKALQKKGKGKEKFVPPDNTAAMVSISFRTLKSLVDNLKYIQMLQAMQRMPTNNAAASTSKIEEIKDADVNMATEVRFEDVSELFNVPPPEPLDDNMEAFLNFHFNVSKSQLVDKDKLKKHIAILDSGATIHCTPNRGNLVNVRKVHPIRVNMANGSKIYIAEAGNCTIRFINKTSKKHSLIILEDVYYHPALNFTLVSQGLLCDKGYKFYYEGNKCYISKQAKYLGYIPKIGGLYTFSTNKTYAAMAKFIGITLYDLHCKLGHPSYEYVKKIVPKVPVKVTDFREQQCTDCIRANIKRNVIPKVRTSELSKTFGERLHIDIWGPPPVEAIGHIRYFLTIVDDATRWVKCLPLKTKDEAFAAYVKYTVQIFTQSGIQVKELQSDNDSVFLSEDFTRYLDSQGTIRRLTVHDTPQQNGVAERAHQTLLRGVRIALLTSGLPKNLWFEALRYTEYWYNRLPKKILNMETPYKKRYSKDYEYKSLIKFGQNCILRKEKTSKLDNRGIYARWLSIDEDSKGHRVYHSQKVSVERNVQFIDDSRLDSSRTAGENNKINNNSKEITNQRIKENKQSNTDASDAIRNNINEDQNRIRNNTNEPRRSTRNKTLTKRARGLNFDEETNIAIYISEFNEYLNEVLGDPVSLKEIYNRSDKWEWIKAIHAELTMLMKRRTWEFAAPPKDKNIIGTKFVFKIKRLANGEVSKYKARLVVQGFAQREGEDFYSNDLYAPTCKLTTVRLMLVWAAYNDYEIHQVDVKSAYLYGELVEGEEIYVKPPPGNFIKVPEGNVLKLRKALYGLKQAGRRWYKTFENILKHIGFRRSYFDNAVFFQRKDPFSREAIIIAIIFIHVDDATIITKDMEHMNLIKRQLRSHVDYSDEGEISWLLGIEIKRDRQARTIKLRQKLHIEKILERFGLQDIRERTQPMVPGEILKQNPNPDENKKLPYMNMVGALRYAADCTRPDISFTCAILARFLQNPSKEHYDAVRICYGYLKRTKDYWLTLGGKLDKRYIQINGYSDADGSLQEGRRPTQGYIFKLGNSTISWRSRKGDLKTLSTYESELYALIDAAKEAIWLRHLYLEVLDTLEGRLPATIICCDNKGTVDEIVKEEKVFKNNTKHIDNRQEWLRDEIVVWKRVEIIWVDTKNQLADMFTKALPGYHIKEHSARLGLE